jgi:hypothetical protein
MKECILWILLAHLYTYWIRLAAEAGYVRVKMGFRGLSKVCKTFSRTVEPFLGFLSLC